MVQTSGEIEIGDGVEGKPPGFDKIYPRIKEVRKRVLEEMVKRDGEASATVLRADDGANVPRGSFELHIGWLQGKRRDGESHQWWPEEAPALIKEVRREDRGNNKKTRIYGLTDYGREFAEWMLSVERSDEDIDPYRLRQGLETQENRIDLILNEVNTQDERLDQVEEELEAQSGRLNTILDYIQEMQSNQKDTNE